MADGDGSTGLEVDDLLFGFVFHLKLDSVDAGPCGVRGHGGLSDFFAIDGDVCPRLDHKLDATFFEVDSDGLVGFGCDREGFVEAAKELGMFDGDGLGACGEAVGEGSLP